MRAVDRPRVLIFIVAYHAEKTIAEVVRRVPDTLLDFYDVEVLIIDDASAAATFERSHDVSMQPLPFPTHVLFNPVNQGYGGNQKLGYHYAIQNGFDFVAPIHGDGQYAPECLPALLQPLWEGQTAAVLGPRMLIPSAARRGGMPLYKFVGKLFIHLSRGLFSYQIFMRIKPRPSLEFLLQTAEEESLRRATVLETVPGSATGAAN